MDPQRNPAKIVFVHSFPTVGSWPPVHAINTLMWDLSGAELILKFAKQIRDLLFCENIRGGGAGAFPKLQEPCLASSAVTQRTCLIYIGLPCGTIKAGTIWVPKSRNLLAEACNPPPTQLMSSCDLRILYTLANKEQVLPPNIPQHRFHC